LASTKQGATHEGAVSLNANGFRKRPQPGILGSQLAPLGQGGGAVLFKDVATVEVTVVVEVVVDRGVNGSKFLKGPDVPEFRHGLLSSSERLMGVSARLLSQRLDC
jgi:hypothetical protein